MLLGGNNPRGNKLRWQQDNPGGNNWLEPRGNWGGNKMTRGNKTARGYKWMGNQRVIIGVEQETMPVAELADDKILIKVLKPTWLWWLNENNIDTTAMLMMIAQSQKMLPEMLWTIVIVSTLSYSILIQLHKVRQCCLEKKKLIILQLPTLSRSWKLVHSLWWLRPGFKKCYFHYGGKDFM